MSHSKTFNPWDEGYMDEGDTNYDNCMTIQEDDPESICEFCSEINCPFSPNNN